MKPILSILLGLAVANGVALADEIKDWNLVMLKATLTAPVTPAPDFHPRCSHRAGGSVRRRKWDRQALHAHLRSTGGARGRIQTRRGSAGGLCHAGGSLFRRSKLHSISSGRLPWRKLLTTTSRFNRGWHGVRRVADQIWAWKSQDGFSNTVAPYLGGTNPGQWRPTPPAMAPGLDPQLATTTPWVLRSPSQFRLAGPPALTSDQYTADFNEVKSMGIATNSGRTADQTLSASFWQAGNPPDYWDQTVLSLAEQHQYSLSDTARLARSG